MIGNNQPQHRISEKLQSFVVQPPRLFFGSRRHLFVRPGTVRDRALKQRAVAEVVTQDSFQKVQIRNSFFDLLQGGADSSKTPNA